MPPRRHRKPSRGRIFWCLGIRFISRPTLNSSRHASSGAGQSPEQGGSLTSGDHTHPNKHRLGTLLSSLGHYPERLKILPGWRDSVPVDPMTRSLSFTSRSHKAWDSSSTASDSKKTTGDATRQKPPGMALVKLDDLLLIHLPISQKLHPNTNLATARDSLPCA